MESTNQGPFASAGTVPWAALPICLRGKVTPYELAILWALQGRGQTCFPSLQQLAQDTSMSYRTVCRVLADLERKGWVQRVASFRDNGARTSNRYQVMVWERYMELAESKDLAPPMPQRHGGVCATEARGHVSDRHGARATEAQEVDKSKKNQKEVENSPSPTPSRRPGRSKPNSPQPAAASVPGSEPEQKAKRKPKTTADPYASKQLPDNAIPNDLLGVQQLLADWWAVKKPSSRTQRAFELACRRLMEQPPEDRELMLTNALIGGWQGLFPPKANAATSYRKPAPWENEHGRSLVEQAFVEGLI